MLGDYFEILKVGSPKIDEQLVDKCYIFQKFNPRFNNMDSIHEHDEIFNSRYLAFINLLWPIL